jgi:hypothetical protein
MSSSSKLQQQPGSLPAATQQHNVIHMYQHAGATTHQQLIIHQ